VVETIGEGAVLRHVVLPPASTIDTFAEEATEE